MNNLPHYPRLTVLMCWLANGNKYTLIATFRFTHTNTITCLERNVELAVTDFRVRKIGRMGELYGSRLAMEKISSNGLMGPWGTHNHRRSVTDGSSYNVLRVWPGYLQKHDPVTRQGNRPIAKGARSLTHSKSTFHKT